MEALAYSPDGNRIVVGCALVNTARVWGAATGAELLTLAGHTGSGVLAVACSPDGSRIVSGSDDNTVRIWDAASGAGLLTLATHAAVPRA